MRWSIQITLILTLVVGMSCCAAGQLEPGKRVGFISYAASADKLLPEERAAYEFVRKELGLPTKLVTFDAIAEGRERLAKYDILWWHYARDLKLPAAARAKPVLDEFKRYLRGGGNLLLTLQACQYVEPLEIDVGPDQVEWKARAAVPKVALRSARNHSIFGMLPERFQLCDAGTLQPATYARWVNRQPTKGRLLAHAVIDEQDKPTYRCIYEWFVGKGRVLAIGEYGFRFTPPDGRAGAIDLRFHVNVMTYLTSSATFNITLRPKGKKVATTHIGYGSKIGAQNTLFVERGSTVEVEFTCMPRRRQDAVLGVALCTVDEEKSVYEIEDWIMQKEFVLKPGREIREKGRFNTSRKPGEYHVIALIAYDNQFSNRPDYAQRLYIVRPSEPNATLSDRALVYAIETDQWLVEFEKVKGAIKGLTHKRYPGLNFAANEFNSSLAKSKSQMLLGDFFVTSRKPRKPWVEEGSAHSTDVREIEIAGDALMMKFLKPSSKLGGFHNVGCVSRFSFNRQLNCLDWGLAITNTGRTAVEVGDVHVPLAFNTSYKDRVRSADDVFERLIMRPDICGASSHVVLGRRSGDPPYLVLVPMAGTPIECLAHDQRANKSTGRDWEGLPYLYLYSKAAREIENWSGWFNGHSSFTLASGETRTFGLRLFWAWSQSDVDKILYGQGRLVTLLSPGYVVPANMPATLRLRCARGVGSVVADKGTTIEKVGEKGHVYRLSFSKPGAHKIKVLHGRGEATYLNVYSLPPLSEIAQKRADFILEHQQFKSAKDHRYLAFGMWDTEDQMLVEDSEAKERSGGSTVTGIGPPLFLAAKNTVWPKEKEVAALESYVREQLYGRIQDKKTYEVHAFIDKAGSGPTSRSYMYPHVFNLYFCMYRIGRDYGLTKMPATDYLRLAEGTAMAYLSHRTDFQASLALGNPGEGTLTLIVAALHREGLGAEAAMLQKAISAKLGALAKQGNQAFGVIAGGRYWPADTTGISGTYRLSRANGWKEGLTRALKALVATRSSGRHWMWYGGDLAWASEIAKYPTLDATTLSHPSAYNAAALLDAGVFWRTSRYIELGYAGVLGPWARVRPDGEHVSVSWFVCGP